MQLQSGPSSAFRLLCLAACLHAACSSRQLLQAGPGETTTFPGCTFLSDSEIATNPDFSTLYYNLQYTGLNNTLANLQSVVTLFAPTNEAFQQYVAAYNETATQAMTEPPRGGEAAAFLLDGLELHIAIEALPGLSSFYDGQNLPTLFPNNNLTVMIEETNRTDAIFVTSYGSEAEIVTPPAYACNASMRSPVTGLVGNTLHTDNQEWLRKDSGIGAGIDSFYEYLLKAYLVFGEVEYLDMFTKVYISAMHGLRLKLLASAPPDSPPPPPWLADADMDTGKLAQPWISSLSAFWPGLQALAGQVEDAKKLLAAWVYAWTQFDGLPDLFDMSASERHPLQKGYPLRPELMESTYLLYAATRDPTLLEVGRTLQATLAEGNKQKCGYAAVADVSTGELEDSMESFLSETSKYLYLLHADAADLPDHYIFSTEGHLLPPFQMANGQQPSANTTMQSASSSYWDWWIPNFGNWLPHTPPADDSVLPLVPLPAHDAILLRQRRCTACLQVSASMVQSATSLLPVGTVDGFQQCSASPDGICPADIMQTQAGLVERRFICLLEVQQDKLQCSQYQEIQLAAEMSSLPNNALVLQQRPTQVPHLASLYKKQGSVARLASVTPYAICLGQSSLLSLLMRVDP
ncbi:hypothetical protein WJX79_002551 [Trebouxia sp. C0005]